MRFAQRSFQRDIDEEIDHEAVRIPGTPGKRNRAQDHYAQTAAAGVSGASGRLPFLEQIQAAFGHHDVRGIVAATGAPARAAGAALGAKAFATGEQVGFAAAPDLHTAAHEAAHVVQQRAGVGAGDAGEVHADQVADLVVRGESAAAALDDLPGGGPAAVQLAKTDPVDGSGERMWTPVFPNPDRPTWPMAFESDGEQLTEASDPAEWQVVMARWTELNSPWPDGPRSRSKSVAHPIDTYLSWLRSFEAIYGTGPAAVQQLRRLYYCEPNGGAGPRFDGMIDTEEELPTCPPLSREVLDRMFETGDIVTHNGDQIDVSHVFVLFDLIMAGTSLVPSVGAIPGAVADQACPLAGLFTWTGDLASWFVQWLAGDEFTEERGRSDPEGATGEVEPNEHENETPVEHLQGLEKIKDSKCSESDLLSNLDAHAMIPQAAAIEGGTSVMSDILERYYNSPADGADRRFHLFLANVTPAIPFTLVSASPFTVALGSGAREVIRDAIWTAICALRKAPAFALDGYTHVLDYIADKFVAFLEGGLASGKGPW